MSRMLRSIFQRRNSRAPFLHGRVSSWWSSVSYGAEAPARRTAALVILGSLAGVLEAAVIVLVVTIATGPGAAADALPLIDRLPSSPWSLAGLAAGSLVALAAVEVAEAWIGARAAAGAQRGVQTMLVDAYLGAPWLRQAAGRTGELQDLVTVKAAAVASGTQQASSALATLANLLVVIVAAATISAASAAFLLSAIAVAIVVGRPFRAYRGRIYDAYARSYSELAVEVTEVNRASRDLGVFGVTGPARRGLVSVLEAMAHHERTTQFAGSAVPALLRALTLLLFVMALALVVSTSDVSLTTLGATVLLVLRALTHAQALTGLSYGLQERESNLELVRNRIADWAPEAEVGTRPCPPISRLALESVSFRWPGADRPALAGIDLELRPGEKLGVVGRTGAGKSTLAAVLLGRIRPLEGRVLIAGVPLSEIDPADWHRRIAWIGQEPHLLTGTVADNIRFLRSGISDDRVRRAAEAAGLGTELTEWPLGLDHLVGPWGAALSGGQHQRIALARALAAEPELLVLDEPTSALDAHAESVVRRTVAGLSPATIAVVIAHRLSTVRALDRIALIEAGRLLAVAPAEELERTQPYFREALELASSRDR